MSASVTFAEATTFLQAQARELAALSLVQAVTPQNIKEFRKQGESAFQSASGGWAAYSKGYAKRKAQYLQSAPPGVVSGAWREYRTLSKADFVFRQKAGHLLLEAAAAIPSPQQASTGKKLGGNSKGKPWVNYPKRRIENLPTNYFTPAVAPNLPQNNGTDFQSLMKALPLFSVGINWKNLNKRGTKLCRINKRHVNYTSAFRKAIK